MNVLVKSARNVEIKKHQFNLVEHSFGRVL